MLPLTMAFTQIQYSLDNSTWLNATSTNQNYTILEELDNGIDESTNYYFRIRFVYDNGNSDWSYVTSRTDTGGEASMGSLAIVGFLTLLSMFVLFLPRLINRFHEQDYVHTLIKGLVITLGIYLLSLTSVVVATISDTLGLGATQEVFRFMFFLNWTGYLVMFFTILFFGKRALDLWKMDKMNEKRGDDD